MQVALNKTMLINF